MQEFEKLISLLEQIDLLNKEIEKEKQHLCNKSLIKYDLKIGDKVKYKTDECILSHVYVAIDKNYSSGKYSAKICFKGKKIKKDGTASLHDCYMYNPNISEAEKI